MTLVRNTLGVGLMAAGLMLAQTPQPAPAPAQGRAAVRMPRRAGMMFRLNRLLNLTDDQKAQAKTIFRNARTTAQPLRTQMHDARVALANAVKSGAADTQIDQLSNNAAQIQAQLIALRTKSFEKFYNLLTPDQKSTLNGAMDRFLSGGAVRPAAWHRAG
jgi:Spy/CpxP family protein refolding chaperone